MPRQYEGEEAGDFQDRATDESIQRDVDDRSETLMAAQRAASGTSPEILSLMDAFAAGQKAGLKGWGPNMNDYQSGTPEHNEWERARSAAIGARLNPLTRRVA